MKVQYTLLLVFGFGFNALAMETENISNSNNKTHLAIFVSGNGSNMQAIIEKVQNSLNIKPCVVISNKSNIPALEKAAKFNIPAEVIIAKKGETDYSKKIIECLNKYEVTPQNGLLCLAGFMKILDKELILAYKNHIINIHPSLLPAFPGLHAIKQAFDHGAKVTGCTVHFVDEGVDTGAIIEQAAVTITDDDTLETLEAKIHEQEHRIFPRVVELFSENRLHLQGNKVKILPEKLSNLKRNSFISSFTSRPGLKFIM